MDGFMNSGSTLISSDGSDLNDMSNMNGMNSMNSTGMISAENYNDNSMSLVNSNMNTNEGLISGDDTQNQKNMISDEKKSTTSSIKNKLSNIEAKSNSMQKKIPAESKPAVKTPVVNNVQNNQDNIANK